MENICKCCNKKYETKNKHRTMCYNCRKIKVPRGLKHDSKPISKKELLK
jgi:hypothetical protein